MSGTTSTTPSTKTTTATTTTGTTATSTSTTTKVDPKAAAATAALNKAAATTAATKPWNVGHKACLTGETACAAAEAERKVAYELKQKQAKNNKDAKKATTADLACTNDGFVDMIQHATNVSLGILSVVKELATGFVPDNFKRAIEYGWNGLTGAGNWLGYILAAIYYLAEEGGFGQDVCDAFGYGYIVVDELKKITDFMPKGEDGKPTGDLSKLASAAAKEVAATGALDAFNKAKNSAEANQKNLVQAAVDAGTSIANNAAKDAAKTASTTPTAKTY